MSESQLRKGALELVILGLLGTRPSYGGEILTRLSEEADLTVSSGTVYPLLARLRKTRLVATSWQESPVGPPRKIYALTSAGRARLEELTTEWNVLAAAVQRATALRRSNHGDQ